MSAGVSVGVDSVFDAEDRTVESSELLCQGLII